MQADLVSVVIRALSFVCLFQAAGGALFLATFGRSLAVTHSGVVRLTRLAAVAAVLFVGLHVTLEAARMSGDLAGMLDASLQSRTMHSATGAMAAVRILGLILIALGCMGERDGRMTVMVVGATLAVASFALVGHTAATAQRWLLSVVLLLHLLVVAFWFGALSPLYLIAQRESAATAASLISAFSHTASWLVPGIFFAGVVISVVLVPRWAVLGEPYGLLLMGKMVGFAMLMGLASLNKWRFGPAVSRAEAGAIRSFRRSVAIEYALIAAVLMATAVLTSFYSPEH